MFVHFIKCWDQAPWRISQSYIIFETVRSKILVWHKKWSLRSILTTLLLVRAYTQLMTYFWIDGIE